MKRKCGFLGFLLFLAVLAGEARAQTFRRATNAGDIVPGLRYVLAAPVYNEESAVYAVVKQDATGTGKKNRKAMKFGTDGNGLIHIGDTDIAMFEAVPSGTSYCLRDVHNGGCLAYSDKETAEQKTGLYTMTDEEIDGAPSSAGRFYKTFNFDFSLTHTCLKTANKVQTGSGDKVFYLLPAHGISDTFGLYQNEDMAGTLYLYKEVVSPSLENEDTGDWTFRGDWAAEDLSRRDYSEALRIDFTPIELPQGFCKEKMPRETLPGEYVWTYVRKGEGRFLPEGWPNVIEVYPAGSEVPGRAVTPVKGGDACVLAAKYPFYTSKEGGISWYRTIPGDGGWMTAGLPFAVQALTEDTPEGEKIEIERRLFDGVSAQGAVFRKAEGGDAWEAGLPCLWKPVRPMAGTVCFHAEEVPVMTGEAAFPDKDGFYATFMQREANDTGMRIYLLDESGEKFVRAAPGSRITSGRGFLSLPPDAGKSVRLALRDGTSGCGAVKKETAGFVPVYTVAGVKAGMWRPGTPLPESLPRGIYVTSCGKLFKP